MMRYISFMKLHILCSLGSKQNLHNSIRFKLNTNRHFSCADNNIAFRFIEERDGNNTVDVVGELNESVLDVAIKHNVDIEGACGGELACSTCHVILSQDLFDKLPKKSEEEQDMLDLAWGLQQTSRLCCQIKVTNDIKDAVFRIPADTNNMFG